MDNITLNLKGNQIPLTDEEMCTILNALNEYSDHLYKQKYFNTSDQVEELIAKLTTNY